MGHAWRPAPGRASRPRRGRRPGRPVRGAMAPARGRPSCSARARNQSPLAASGAARAPRKARERMRKPARSEVCASSPWKASRTSGAAARSTRTVVPSRSARRCSARASFDQPATGSAAAARSTMRVVGACRSWAAGRAPPASRARPTASVGGASPEARGSSLRTMPRRSRAWVLRPVTRCARTSAASAASRSHSGPWGT